MITYGSPSSPSQELSKYHSVSLDDSFRFDERLRHLRLDQRRFPCRRERRRGRDILMIYEIVVAFCTVEVLLSIV